MCKTSANKNTTSTLTKILIYLQEVKIPVTKSMIGLGIGNFKISDGLKWLEFHNLIYSFDSNNRIKYYVTK